MQPFSPSIDFENQQLNESMLSLETSNTEFIDRLCSHVQELCLTKTSFQTISNMCNETKNKINQGGLCKAIFTEFFDQIAQFSNTTIIRLKKLDNKKFQSLIKRKLTDIFGCVMRYSYDLKMIALADKANELKRMAKLNTSFCSLQILISQSLNQSFMRIKSVGYLQPQIKKQIYKNKFLNVMWKMNFFLKSRQKMQLKRCLLQWNLKVKQSNFVTNNLVSEKTKSLFIQLANSIDNHELLHVKIIESFKQFCEIDRIQYYKYSNNVLISYNQQLQSLSDRSEFQICIKEPPQGLYKQSIQTQQMVTESLNNHTSRLFIPLIHGSIIGLIVLTYENSSLDWKQIELLLNYCKHIGQVVGQIYQIQSRIEYYSKTQLSVDSMSKIIYNKYCESNPTNPTFKVFLNQIFQILKLNEVQISFIGQNNFRFYLSKNTMSSLEDKQFLSLITSQFRFLHKDILQIKKNNKLQVIIGLKDQRQLIGYIKYTPTVISHTITTTILKHIIPTLIQKLKNQQILLKSTSRTNQITEIHKENNQTTKILMSRYFDEIQDIFKTKIEQFGGKLYGFITWKHKNIYFVKNNNKLQIIDKIINQIQSNEDVKEINQQFSSDLNSLLRCFPCFQQSQLYEYQNHNKNMKVYIFNFVQFKIIIGGFEDILSAKQIMHSTSIDPKIPYEDLVQLGKSISIRVKKGYINEDQYTNPQNVKHDLIQIDNFLNQTKNNNFYQSSSKDQDYKQISQYHGKYLKYQNSQLLLVLNDSNNHNKNILQMNKFLNSLHSIQKQRLLKTQMYFKIKLNISKLNLLLEQKFKMKIVKVINKFKEKLQIKLQKQRMLLSMCNFISRSQKPLIEEIFLNFKNSFYIHQIDQNKNTSNIQLMFERLYNIFIKRTFVQVKKQSINNFNRKVNLKLKLKQIINAKARKISNSNKTIINIIHQNYLKYLKSKREQMVKGLIYLSNFIDNKIKNSSIKLFQQMNYQAIQFSEAVLISIQELSLIRMNSFQSLLSFVQQRLLLHLSKQTHGIQICFQVSKLKMIDIKIADGYSYIIASPHIIVQHFQGQQYILAAISIPTKSYCKQLQKLFMPIKNALFSIKQNQNRKLSFFCQILQNHLQKNTRKALYELFNNLLYNCRADLAISYQMSKQAQSKLLNQQIVSSSQKQNIQINNSIKAFKDQILKNNKIIQAQKLQNKIKRKTLATSFIQLKNMNHQIQKIQKQKGLINIHLQSQINSSQQKQEKQIDKKLMKSGLKSILRLLKNKNFCSSKDCFNKIMNYALDN